MSERDHWYAGMLLALRAAQNTAQSILRVLAGEATEDDVRIAESVRAAVAGEAPEHEHHDVH